MMTLKISLAVFFLRIIVRRWQRLAIYTTISISTGFSIAYFFFTIFQCGYFTSPVQFFVKKLSGECVSRASIIGMNFTHAGVMTLTDWPFVILPLSLLRRSLLKRKEKFVVGFLLMLGAA
jgi:hypothetical protein